MISLYSVVAVDRRGRIHIAEPQQPEISVFDATGEYLRTLGGRGTALASSGMSRTSMSAPSSSMSSDRRRGRTLLDHDFNVVDVHRFPGVVDETFVTDSDDVVWMVGDVPMSASVGHRIHILGLSGEIRAFGGDRSPVFRAQRAFAHCDR